MRDSTARRLSTLHRVAYRATGGRIGRRLVRNDMLLLTTTGRVTRRPHTVPLLYLLDDAAPVVVASWGGRPDHPEWFANLVAEPSVGVEILQRHFEATAIPMQEPERTAWWNRAVAAYDGYAGYQAKTDRVIPIVRLVPDGVGRRPAEHD
jgi:deazaflavin-dependent oxidoreductase (nitroreductase family)